MADRKAVLSDAGLAFLIGALTGVGAVLLLRTGDDETGRVIRALRDEGVRARRASDRMARELTGVIGIARRIRSLNGS